LQNEELASACHPKPRRVGTDRSNILSANRKPRERSAVQFDQNVSLLKGLVKEGFERATAWLHIFAALFAFTSDLLKPLIPRCSLLFVIGGLSVAAVVFFLATRFGKASEKLAAVFSASLILAICSLGFLLLQQLMPNENGVLADLVPGIEQLQKKLGIIQTNLELYVRRPSALKAIPRTLKAKFTN
jgi:hypothetical protein